MWNSNTQMINDSWINDESTIVFTLHNNEFGIQYVNGDEMSWYVNM